MLPENQNISVRSAREDAAADQWDFHSSRWSCCYSAQGYDKVRASAEQILPPVVKALVGDSKGINRYPPNGNLLFADRNGW